MPSKQSDAKEKAGFWDMLGFFILKTTDSGLAPWVLVALFFIGLTWVLTRNLDSQDDLKFLSSFLSLTGFAWAGWLVAFIQIPVFNWALNRARGMRINQLNDLRDQNEKYAEMLKKMKQTDLELKR
jgi:hypothetical protein